MTNEATTLTKRAGATVSVASVLVLLVTLDLDGQIASQRVGPQVATLSGSRIITESASSLIVIGTADDATATQADAQSYENAVYRAATEFNGRLFDDVRTPVSVSFEDLKDYVRRYARVTGKQSMTVGTGVRAFTRLEINKVFIDPLRIRNLGPSKSTYGGSGTTTDPARDGAEGYLLVPTGRLASRAGTEFVTRRVPVQTPSARNGSFHFVFTIRGVSKGNMSLRLDRIEVEEDGSPGDATWSFNLTTNGRRIMTLAPRPYNNDVRQYPMRVGDSAVEATLPATDPNLEVRIVGQRR